jgi:ribonuclease H2 subunit A
MSKDLVCSWPRVNFPSVCRDVDLVIGIDEAGRGPVLGSLVYVAAFWPKSEHESICKLGFDDSKQLKEGQRDDLFAQIRNHGSIGWVIEEISASEISKLMLKPQPVSLNTLSYNAVIRALETIKCADNASGARDIYVDTVGDPEFYKSTLVRALGEDYGSFTIEKKADAIYRVVSAASIIAKVTRDTLMREYEWVEHGMGLEKTYGSGYPGDEACVKWLVNSQQKVFGFPNLVRFSWSTSRESLLKGNACEVLWECDEDPTTGGADILSHFSVGVKKQKRSAFFTKRKMQLLTTDFLK